ncbi:TonB-linked SusC/RagA family outer membrane protein [Pedobacter sp. AK017]|uniref:SusC/RagA family TonB-linked outer membrane protein n=1 Tax=Pedobacter sp. AK017 TaxID=2723073 RepID=UPI00161E8622|nr:TonB-dependent receptor [Pedobacter sp. AK017]MBB5441183.1 TonB-linked SusC/RagA family outer membrane protein [Pedobacter sp. AK017]
MKSLFRKFFLLFLWLSFFVTAAQAQLTDVLGLITNDKGVPLADVTVRVSGGNASAATGKDGRFRIKASLNSKLLVTSIGYKNQEVLVDKLRDLKIILYDDVGGLDEIVVVGYGEVKKKDLTGSVAAVNMKDLNKAPVKSFDDALAGRVAGVVVAGNDGQPGALNNIVIRGGNSITQDNSPLYVVDGFPLEATDFNTISPADIESIDILKDASATAIYGARGANGVIIVTTKSGQRGTPVITYNAYYGIQKLSKKMPMMDPYEFVKYQTEYSPTLASSYIPGSLSPSDPAYDPAGRTLESYRNIAGLNWQDLLFRTAKTQNHDISLRGGNDKTTYAVSGNILDQEGIFVNSGFARYQGRVVLDHKVNTKVKIGLNLNYGSTKSTGQRVAGEETNGSLSLMYGVLGYRPVTGNGNIDLLDDLTDPEAATNNYSVNPLINAQNSFNETRLNSMIANAFLEYTVLKNLTFRTSGGVTTNQATSEVFNSSLTQSGNPASVKGNHGIVMNTTNNTWLNENLLTFRKTYNNNHRLNLVGGFTMQGNKTSRRGFEGRILPNESLGLDGIDEAVTQISTSASSRWTMASVLGRVNYDYKSKYLITASFRADGSSRFASGKQWAYFPSGSVAWRMSSENFMKDLVFVNDAKLRVSYGRTGNNRISEFSYLSQLRFLKTDAYSYNNAIPSIGIGLKLLGNPDLIWESTDQFNLGYDLNLFNNRITMVADVYKKITRDLLLNAQLPYTTGISEAFKNIGRMSNEGLEFTINTNNITNRNFSWNSSFNISFNRNKVLALTDNQNSLLTTARFDSNYNGLFSYIALIGGPVAQMHGLVWEGNYQYEDFDRLPDGRYLLKDKVPYYGSLRKDIQPGDIKYKDINGDQIVDVKDYTIIGRAIPIHTGGLTNNFTYKGFDLNVFLQWSYGNDILNANRLVFEGNGRRTQNLNQFASFQDRWTPENTTSPNFRANGMGPAAISSRVIENGSYLRLKTVSLGYNLKTDWLNKIKVKSARIYASAQNLWTLTDYTGFDPEVSSRNSPLTPGFDYSPYPRARTIIFGINTSF